MIAMEMAEEVGFAAFDGAVAKSIDANEESRHDLVERTGTLVCRHPPRCVLGCRGRRPSSILSVAVHEFCERRLRCRITPACVFILPFQPDGIGLSWTWHGSFGKPLAKLRARHT